jgi:hypothetical protein
MWLLQDYLQKLKFIGMMICATVPPVLLSPPVGRYLGALWGIDDQLIIGGLFFGLLAAEVYAYDRLQTWWYFQKLRR